MSAYFCEINIGVGATSGAIDGFLTASLTDITLTDGTNSVSLPYTQGAFTKVGVSYSATDGLMELNVNGVVSETSYTGTLLSGALDLLRGTTGVSLSRNVRRYAHPTYAENKAQIDELMAL